MAGAVAVPRGREVCKCLLGKDVNGEEEEIAQAKDHIQFNKQFFNVFLQAVLAVVFH